MPFARDTANPNNETTMKNTTTLLIATTIAGGLLLMGCSNTAENQAEKMENKMDNVQDKLDDAAEAETRAKYESERADALDKLYDMRDNIDRELVKVNERLATKEMKADKRAEQEALKAELENQRTEVARVITHVESSQQGTWISVKEDTRKASEKFEDWWDRTKDNMEDATKSDKDRK
jgi:outer membrane murein-binding lipoprotein Lpp